MDYLKRFTKKLLSSTDLEKPYQMVITYSEMAHSILFTIILVIIKAYGTYYPLLDNALYCVTIAILYIVYTLTKIGWRYNHGANNKKQLNLLAITILAVVILGGVSYYHVDRGINDYVGHSKFYLHQEGDYAVLLDSPIEMTTIEGKAYKKFSATLLSVHPFKDTAPNMYTKTTGQLQITIEEQNPSIIYNNQKRDSNRLDSHVVEDYVPLVMGQIVIIKGTPKPLYVVEERGAIDLRSRAIRSEQMGKIFGGTYRMMKPSEYDLYDIDKRVVYYSKFLTVIGKIRAHIEQTMDSYLGEHTKWLGTSLVLGGHYGELGEETLRQFAYTGIIHILSISGSHIALLFAIVYALCRWCCIKKRYAMIIGIFVSILYCMIVGFSAPVVRSTVMGICMAMAYLYGRLYTAKQGLAITAIVFLLYDPLLILDVSFQLSFGATYGLLIFGMPLYHWMEQLPPLVKGPIILCVSAQLIMIPFQLYYFHYISLASILAALLVTPILDLTIVLLFVTTIIDLVMPISLLWWGIDGLLRLALTINAYLANNSALLLWVGVLPFALSIIYFLMIGILYVLAVPMKARRFIPLPFIVCMILLFIAYRGLYYKEQQIAHIVPLKQANVLLLANPYDKRGIVYIEASKDMSLQSIEYRIINSLQGLGIPPQNTVIKRFQSTDNYTTLYDDERSRIVVYNGQKREKNIQLRDGKESILITSRQKILDYEQLLHKNTRILISSPYGAVRDLEPDSEDLELWGYRYMEDSIL
ncbi:ComEC/Rec2 family competence protein [Veillonella agrestimuris]|uniref:ComEC/Rec2 family competence protein n=1 Tax=Veillonella agrestimuris TaxID=2941340 RepID=UPI00203E499D|nr:ComEC/Rec2 family competence protein [Veillonella agrestimuris]